MSAGKVMVGRDIKVGKGGSLVASRGADISPKAKVDQMTALQWAECDKKSFLCCLVISLCMFCSVSFLWFNLFCTFRVPHCLACRFSVYQGNGSP